MEFYALLHSDATKAALTLFLFKCCSTLQYKAARPYNAWSALPACDHAWITCARRGNTVSRYGEALGRFLRSLRSRARPQPHVSGSRCPHFFDGMSSQRKRLILSICCRASQLRVSRITRASIPGLSNCRRNQLGIGKTQSDTFGEGGNNACVKTTPPLVFTTEGLSWLAHFALSAAGATLAQGWHLII